MDIKGILVVHNRFFPHTSKPSGSSRTRGFVGQIEGLVTSSKVPLENDGIGKNTPKSILVKMAFPSAFFRADVWFGLVFIVNFASNDQKSPGNGVTYLPKSIPTKMSWSGISWYLNCLHYLLYLSFILSEYLNNILFFLIVFHRIFNFHHNFMIFSWYGWWRKSCTTWDVHNPVNNGRHYLFNIKWCRISSTNTILLLLAFAQLHD